MDSGGVRTDQERLMRTTLRALVQFRLVMVTAILGLGIVAIRGQSGDWNLPFFTMLAITVLLSAFYWAGIRWGRNFRFQGVAQLFVDMGLATGIVHYTGEFASPFSLLYIVIIAAGSRFLFLKGTVLLALLCAATHGAHLSLHLALEGAGGLAAEGALPTFGMTDEAQRVLAVQVGLYTITFVFIAVLSGYLSVRVQRKGAALDEVRTLLRRDRLNTDQILRSLSSGLITVDRRGMIVNFNRAAERITGLETRMVTGRQFERVLEEVSPPLVTLLRGILSGWEDVLRQETTLRSLAGSVVPIGMSASPLRDEEGRNAGVVCIFQDLTEVRRMEDHIRSVDRLAAVGELSAGIAHEIRNPLATISGSIQVLLGELRMEGENQRLLDLVVRESDRLHRIVEDFLDFARTGPIEARPVDLVALLEEIRDMTANHPKRAAGTTVRVEAPGRRPEIAADAEQLRRAFLNLAVNAFEAMGNSGTLTFRVGFLRSYQSSPGDTPGEAVVVEVRDTGPGIPDGRGEELLRPFFTTKKGGVGLGLALAQKVVVAHRGRIEVGGDARGAAFTVILPWDGAVVREREAGESTGPAEAVLSAPAALSGIRG
ncbi:MAG: ATP-binding protein [Candidatus Eisenbacteria bacterium]